LADNQEVISGERAYQEVMDLNKKVVVKFNTLTKFNDDIRTSKNLKDFYDN